MSADGPQPAASALAISPAGERRRRELGEALAHHCRTHPEQASIRFVVVVPLRGEPPELRLIEPRADGRSGPALRSARAVVDLLTPQEWAAIADDGWTGPHLVRLSEDGIHYSKRDRKGRLKRGWP